MWTRDCTQKWIAQITTRIDDLKFYLSRTIEWCDENDVINEKIVFVCKFMTLVWVSHLRREPISKHEIFEILEITNWGQVEDAEFGFNSAYESMELEELLTHIVDTYH